MGIYDVKSDTTPMDLYTKMNFRTRHLVISRKYDIIVLSGDNDVKNKQYTHV